MSNDIYVVIEHIRGKVAEISYLMLAAGRQLVDSTSGELVAVLLGSDVESLTSDLAADKVLYLDDSNLADFTPDAYVQCLKGLIGVEQPRAVLLGHTSIGMEVASLLSVKADAPLISSCISFSGDASSLTFTEEKFSQKALSRSQQHY